jgi:hypothetical protein
VLIELELHPRWPAEWSIEKRERAALALATHLMNSKVHTLYGFHTDIKSVEPVHVPGANPELEPPVQARQNLLITLEIEEKG